MYHQQQPMAHPGLIPQSDGRRLIFPLSQWTGTFKTENFLPSLVDYRCSLDDIQYFLSDLYNSTKRLRPIRVANRLVIWSFIFFFFCFIFGIMLEFDSQEAMSNYSYNNEENKYQYSEPDDTGITLIFGAMIALMIVNVCILVYRNKSKTKLFRQIVTSLERHKYSFLQKGLRWAVPENCQWLELWMDYRYFSPYYLQPYIPQMAIQGNFNQATQSNSGQAIPFSQLQSVPINQNYTNSNATNAKDQNGQQPQQGYPTFELHNIQAGQNTTEVVNNSNGNANGAGLGGQGHIGYGRAMPQQYFQPQQLAHAYGYYQNPQLNDTLLGYPVPVQESENMRMIRPPY